jgi:SAM-dependent methyltransferase
MRGIDTTGARAQPPAPGANPPGKPARLLSDYRHIARIYGDPRPPERIIAHYELERRLAMGLRTASKAEREQGLYTQLYDTLLGELDDHPRKRPVTKRGLERRERYVKRQVRMILERTPKDSIFVEMGGGDCDVALRVAPHVAQSIAIDVTDELLPPDAAAPNFQFIKTAGIAVPLPDASVDFVYSNQVMEHLHPEDAVEQVREILRILKPGGQYLCRTPNKTSGPHDVSRYFDVVAAGTHMKEYSYSDIASIFAKSGFTNVRIILAARAFALVVIPPALAFAIEDLFGRVPRRLHTSICRNPAVRALLGVTIIGEKPR